MADWPNNPVARMAVRSFHGGTESTVQSLVTTAQETVSDIHITFRVAIEYHDHPYFDHGRGFFSATVEKLTTNGYQLLTSSSKTLGNNDHDGDWYDELALTIQMSEPVEAYKISIHCETRDTTNGTSEDQDIYVGALQGSSYVGDFSLDFVPLSIVYCPPGQDMTASLTQSEEYGTRYTIGTSSGMQAEIGVQATVDVLGLFGEGVGYSESQTNSNQTTSGIQVSHFRNTVVTADNQKAIGRAYWGPLGDLFALLVNPRFAVSKRADGTMFYALKTIQQVVILPVWKLLRPDQDPIASAIPATVRRKLLELDPFLKNLDRFFPDSGADLSIAANPYADPSGHNRAELLGRWWLDVGSEMTYAQGESHQLFNSQTNEVRYESTVTIDAQAGASYEGITAALGVSAGNTTWVGLQSSKETDAAYSKSASCTIIRNQNERDLDGVELYYDKVFSTFMFRRLNARRRPGDPGVGWGIVQGTIRARDTRRLGGLNVRLLGAGGTEHVTSTTRAGEYSFHNLLPGTYRLIAGDQETKIEVGEDASWLAPVTVDLSRVRRTVDLVASPIWELREALHLPSDKIRTLGAAASGKKVDVAGAATAVGVSPKVFDELEPHVVVNISEPAPRKK